MTGAARILMCLAAISAALAVALGAFGAHLLKQKIDEPMLLVWEKAVQYHFYHALGLAAVAFAAGAMPASGLVRWSGGLMTIGTLLFCGSLYVMALTSLRWLGAITPLGGVAFIAAWILLATALVKGSGR